MSKSNLQNTTVILFLTLALLFFYVYQRIQIFRIGYKMRSIDRKISTLEKENSYLELKISSLESPLHIAEEVKRLGLDLVPPKEKQIVRVTPKES